jgi:hypothetical protein
MLATGRRGSIVLIHESIGFIGPASEKSVKRMGIGFSKLPCFAYWTLREIFKAIYNDGFDDFKAQVVLGVTALLGVLTLLSLISLHVGRQMLPTSKAGASSLGVGILVAAVILNFIFFRQASREI